VRARAGAGPGDSTRPRPRSRAPNRDGSTPHAFDAPRAGVDGAALIELTGPGQEEFSPRSKGLCGEADRAARELGRIGTAGAAQALRGRAGVEEDAWVREEIETALEGAGLA
jgi:hypothetical protein